MSKNYCKECVGCKCDEEFCATKCRYNPEITRLTNYEKITRMSLDNLALFLSNFDCNGDCPAENYCDGMGCSDGWTAYLKGDAK